MILTCCKEERERGANIQERDFADGVLRLGDSIVASVHLAKSVAHVLPLLKHSNAVLSQMYMSHTENQNVFPHTREIFV